MAIHKVSIKIHSEVALTPDQLERIRLFADDMWDNNCIIIKLEDMSNATKEPQ